MPNLPDPVIDSDGRAQFPRGFATVPEQTRQACQSLFNRLIPTAPARVVTQTQLRALIEFARCMRSHGVPDWPDPNATGEFPLPPRLASALKSVFRTPFMACDRFNPDPHGRLYSTHA